MMDGVRSWLLAMIFAAVLCALAKELMPAGPVKRVGGLVCGMVLLAVMLSPLVQLNPAAGQAWLEGWRSGLEQQEAALRQQVNEGVKPIIEQEFAAYIVDKAAEMGLNCTARVSCRAEENGLYLPDRTEVAGPLSQEERGRLSQLIQEELGVPADRQAYYSGEELP